MNMAEVLQFLGLVVVVSPASLLSILGMCTLLGFQLSEVTQSRFTKASVIAGLLSSATILIIMLSTGKHHVPIEIGNWVSIESHLEHFHFHFKFVFDRLSVPFVILSYVLCGTVGAFASVYLHRDRGYTRFFLFYAVFQLGMVLSSVADTIETLFLGWELVGLSSALLVAYFHERPGPVRNGLRVWIIYRISDAAFLIAVLLLHHLTGEGDFEKLMGVEAWPEGTADVPAWEALIVGSLLLLAAAGKSGMLPFSGWLPRAMEGPTPSSAVFYGALSVHLGTFLLLRISPLFDRSMTLTCMVIGLGLASALFGALVSRVQNDVKNALAFASLTQVGIITVEIGLGFDYIALIHMIGHACLRTLQLLRAPSVLKDFQSLENAVGGHLSGDEVHPARQATSGEMKLYRFALERGYLDNLLQDWFVYPFITVFRTFDWLERKWTEFLTGPTETAVEEVSPYGDSLEDVV